MSDYPFAYLHSGRLDAEYIDKVGAVWIGFAAPLSPEQARELAMSCPQPVAGFFHADDRLFYCETEGDVFEPEISVTYGDSSFPVSQVAADAFIAAVDSWLLEAHRQVPIAFAIGVGEVSPTPADVSLTLDWLDNYLDNHALPVTQDDSAEEPTWDETADPDSFEFDPYEIAPVDLELLSFVIPLLDVPGADQARLAALGDRINAALESPSA